MNVRMTMIEGSSSVNSIGHDPEENQMYVQFHDGGLYQYNAVTKDEYNSIFTDESKGKAVFATIKGKSYTKISQ